jgi:AraC-like DNA-binding protein
MARGAFLSSSLRYAAEELSGNAIMVARLSQLFFEEAITRYLETLSPDEEQRLAALRDPAIGRALKLLQDVDRAELTLDVVAREAGLSRTVLIERFIRLFGEPPMRYRLNWRLRRAAQQLRNGGNIADVAHGAGFSGEATFTRAFKRRYGLPPAAWRAEYERSRLDSLPPT